MSSRWVWDHTHHIGNLFRAPSAFAVIMDRLTDEIRRESLLNIVFADDVLICSQRRQQVERGPIKVEVCTGEKRNES